MSTLHKFRMWFVRISSSIGNDDPPTPIMSHKISLAPSLESPPTHSPSAPPDPDVTTILQTCSREPTTPLPPFSLPTRDQPPTGPCPYIQLQDRWQYVHPVLGDFPKTFEGTVTGQSRPKQDDLRGRGWLDTNLSLPSGNIQAHLELTAATSHTPYRVHLSCPSPPFYPKPTPTHAHRQTQTYTKNRGDIDLV